MRLKKNYCKREIRYELGFPFINHNCWCVLLNLEPSMFGWYFRDIIILLFSAGVSYRFAFGNFMIVLLSLYMDIELNGLYHEPVCSVGKYLFLVMFSHIIEFYIILLYLFYTILEIKKCFYITSAII